MPETIMIVDEPSQLRTTEYAVQQKLHYHTVTAGSGEEAIQWVLSPRQPQPGLLLIDLLMPGIGGLQAIRAIRLYKPQLPIIALTPYGDDESARQAMELGASDFLVKPVTLLRLGHTIRNVLRLQQLNQYVAYLERKTAGYMSASDIVGASAGLKAALALAGQAASTRMPVWICGEAGTGKELLARAIHGGGDRAGKPFVIVSCKALPEAAAEATLFGQDKQPGKLHFALGKLREADQGTLLLKDIGALSPPMQQRLLETMETGTVRPLAAGGGVPVDLRIVCTTSEPVESLIAHGRFSHTLYRRLKSLSIDLPPLRERREDIAVLAQHFIRAHAASEHKYIYGATEQALQLLGQNGWPGNVRQLSQTLWRAVMLCDRDTIDTDELQLVHRALPQRYLQGEALASGGPALLDMQGRIKKLKSIEEEVIRFALRHSGGCMTRAARNLGIGRSTLYRRVSELQLEDHISRANQTTRPMMKVSSMERS